MKVIFFEVQDWEQEIIKVYFPDSIIVSERLTPQNGQEYKDAEIISCFIYSEINKNVIDLLPNLKFISTRSTGFDHIDIDYCKKRNIVVSNVPEYGSATVAEHTFALILSLTRKIIQSVNQSKNLNFKHDSIRGTDLFGKTIGIIGLGKIGTHILRIAKGFGMNILVYNRSRNEALRKEIDFQYVDLQTIFHSSDILTLHLPLNSQTKHIINKANIGNLKKGCYLVNTSRGGLIETEAIVQGLNSGILAGVGLDVLEEEYELEEEAVILTSHFQKEADLKNLVFDHILINHPNVIITPHNAFNSNESLKRIIDMTAENIKHFISRNLINVIESNQS